MTQNYLRRYISHCKINVHPQLTDDCVELLSQMWAHLRQTDFNSRTVTHSKVLPITIRSYETLIRLSTSHAKIYQSPIIQIRDCIEAFRLVIYTLYGDKSAQDDKLKEILKKLHLYDPIYFSSSESQEEPSKVPKASRSAVKKNN